jgi:hypothetical protein
MKTATTKIDSRQIRLSTAVLAFIDKGRRHPMETTDSVLRRKFKIPARKHWISKLKKGRTRK